MSLSAHIVPVEHRNDPVSCPECEANAQKENDPLIPWRDPKNAERMNVYLGLAICENPDCETHITWIVSPRDGL